MVKRLLTILVFLLPFIPARPQSPQIDSVQKDLKKNLPDTVRALTMKNLAFYYETVDPEKALTYYDDAIRFSIKSHLDFATGYCYSNKAFPLMAMAQYARAITVLDSAFFYTSRSTDPKKDIAIAKIYQNLAACYRDNNQPKQAVDYNILAIALFEKLNRYAEVVQVYYNLSLIYKASNQIEKQLDCAKKMQQAAERSGNPESLFQAYTIQANSYTNLVLRKEAASARDSAEKFYDSSYKPVVLIAYHLVSGSIYMDDGKLDKARSEFAHSLAIAKKIGHTFSIVQSEMQLSRILALQKKYDQSKAILDSAASVIALTKELVQQKTLVEYYARLYEEQGKYKEAIAYYDKYFVLSDSLTKTDNRHYVAELEARYEAGKKESQIKELQIQQELQQVNIRQKNILVYILGAFAITLLILSWFAYKNYRQKQRLQQQRISELETEKQLTATEAVLKGEALERTRLAQDLHDGLGGMLSGIKYSLDTVKTNLIMTPENQQAFERSIDMLDSSIHEMRRVAHNMMPESLVKFGLDTALKDFCEDITASGAISVEYQSIGIEGQNIDQTIAITVYRIIQELINNIIKHAAATNAIVQLSKTGKNISITVEDDGKGFDPDQQPSGSKGMGWRNIQNRIDLVKGRLDVKSIPGNGTSILIEFNV